MNRRYFLIGLVLIPLPWIMGSSFHNMLIMMIFYAYLATAWNILGGFTGQLSLGHSLFFGMGAYASTIFSVYYGFSPWLGMLVGGVVAAIISVFIGLLSFHYGLRGPYFTLASIAFSQAALTIVLNVDFLGAAAGYRIPLNTSPTLLNFQFTSKIPYFFVGLGMLVTLLLITYFIRRGRMGHYFVAIRDNEELAQGLGVSIIRYKCAATVISAFFTGIGGTFYAQYYLNIDPRDVLGIDLSIELALFSIVGGAGTLFGPMIGAFILTIIAELTRSFAGAAFSGAHMMVYGLILMIVIIFIPNGIMGLDWGMLRRKHRLQQRSEHDPKQVDERHSEHELIKGHSR
jgi:branched-chain amino acid transport system permease protein